MADEHLRTDEDIEAILRLAVQQTGTESESLRTRLMATAEEIGLTPEQVAAAEEAYRQKVKGERTLAEREENERQLWKQFRRSQRGDLISHVGSYLAVNAFLVAIDLMGGDGLNWAYWPMMGWGIAIAIHLFSFVAGESSDNVQEFEKWKRRKRKREKKDTANPDQD